MALRTRAVPGVSPRSYGAKGDGVTDDTAAIQAALDEALANGYPVVFDRGVYVTGPLTPAGVEIYGVSRNDCWLKPKAGSTGAIFKITSTAQGYRTNIHDLSIDGDGIGTEPNIWINNVNEVTIRDVYITKPGFSGMKISSASPATATVPIITNCIIRGQLTSTTFSAGNGIDLSDSSDCIVTNNDVGFFKNGIGILLAGHNGGVVSNNNVWQCGKNYQIFNSERTRLIGNMSDYATFYGFAVSGSPRCVISSNYARSSGDAGYFIDAGCNNTIVNGNMEELSVNFGFYVDGNTDLTLTSNIATTSANHYSFLGGNPGLINANNR